MYLNYFATEIFHRSAVCESEACRSSKTMIADVFKWKFDASELWTLLANQGEIFPHIRGRKFIKDDEDSQVVAAFDDVSSSRTTEELYSNFQVLGNCVGLSVLRQIHNDDGHVPDLLVAPLYAISSSIAEVLLRYTLKKHYNPDDDYDFDVDYLAIYRRTVTFFVFSPCESFMFPLLKKLAGSDGKMEKDRLTFQSCSNFQLPAVNHDFIFAISDPFIHLC
uniref:Lipase_3 domain-containing protein n=1 Tax=Caenorhabditis tropicalis TaxID=1561998 RepID=A0A1I7UDG2_9PELO